MKQSFLDFISSKSIVLGDGAMGSMLIDAGMNLGNCAELWNIEKPETVFGIHQQYVKAGSDFILTNTFGANPFRLADHGLQDRTAELNQAAVELARRVAGDSCYVIGSIGPTGRVPQPIGNTDKETLIKGFRMQAEALIAGGVDGIITETMMHTEEALCALEAVRAIKHDIPVISSICFQYKDETFQTAMGKSPAEAAKELTEAGSHIIGANCMVSFELYAELTSQLREGTHLPIMVQPNAGQPIINDGNVRYPMTPENMMKHIPTIIQAGAKIIGGCCGTTPAHIAAIRTWMDMKS